MIKNKTVLVVGSLNMDLVASAARLPARGETVFGERFATFPGGKGANQAVAAGKLGAAVKMVGCVGQDGFGRELMDSLKASGVDTTFVDQVEGATGTALITVETGGANTIVVVSGANAACCPQHVDAALAAETEPGILVVQNEIPQATVEHAIRAAKARGWTVILNPAPARAIGADVMPLVDIIIPNETEMSVLTGLPVKTEADAFAAAARLLAQGVGAVIITLGDKGAVCCRRAEQFHVPPYRVQAVDTTAAGDAYAGALATALAEGKTLRGAMQFASAVAALSVTRAGAQPSLPWRDETDAFISKWEVRV